MGYGMKYTKGGFPFKASPAKNQINIGGSKDVVGEYDKSDNVDSSYSKRAKTNQTTKAVKRNTYNEEEEKVITSMPSPIGDGGGKTDYFISNLHKDTQLSLDKKKKISNEQDDKELDLKEDAEGK